MVQVTLSKGTSLLKGREQLLARGVLFVCAFYLAQAVVFEASVPFLLPFWAVVRERYRGLNKEVLIGGLLGSLFLGVGQTAILILQLLMYEGLIRFRYWRISLPVAVLLGTLSVQTVWQVVMYGGDVPLIVVFYVASEAVLACFLAFFMLTFFVRPHEWFREEWGTERVAAGLIVLATLLTGMGDVTVASFGLAPFLLHLVICLAAFIGGVQLGTVVAIVLGALLGLAKLSFTGMLAVYGMTGLIAGMCARYGRVAIVIGSMAPSVFYFFYDATLPLDEVYFVSISCAGVLFLALRKANLNRLPPFFMPTSETILLERQSWMTEHVSVKLSHFQQFVTFLTELVFDRFTSPPEQVDDEVGPAATCLSCFRYDRCWDEHSGMDQLVADWFVAKSGVQMTIIQQAEDRLRYKCVKANLLLDELNTQFYKERMNEQYYHGKKMIALQLKEMSRHLQGLIEEMQEDAVSFVQLEEQLLERLQLAHVECFQVDLVNNELGARKVICSVASKKSSWESNEALAERMILPVLYDVLGEPFQVEKTIDSHSPFFHHQITFRSAVAFEVEYDIYSSAKGGTLLSGDSHDIFSLHPGLLAVMLADGMGQSKEAQRESRRLIRLMRECLSYQMTPETAMHTLHYVMALKRNQDMYATIDFALVDLQGGSLWTWKAGGMSTFVLRGEQLLKVESNAAPVGFMPVFSVETVKLSIKSGDIVVMYSDGLFSSVHDWETQEKYFLEQLRTAILEQPHLEQALDIAMGRYQSIYEVEDDCTVIVLKIGHVTPEWSVYKPSVLAVL